MKAALLSAAALLVATPAFAQDGEDRDWAATLRADAQTLHDLVIENHPGVYDHLNPGFRAQVDAGLQKALLRAETTTDKGGWWWALREYVAGFNDGHLQIGMNDQTFGFPSRWPGFLTSFQGADQVVGSVDANNADLPPLGARLIDCDGLKADDIAARRVGDVRGRWFLESTRHQLGSWVFLDAQNPWIETLRTCRFETSGETRSYSLSWRPISNDDLAKARAELAAPVETAFGMQHGEDGSYWLSMPSFNGDPEGEAHKALTPMIVQATAEQAALRAAPYVVLDLRGNGGGSSHWSQEIAEVLWGEAWVAANEPAPVEAIEWRASNDNLKALQSYVDQWTAAGEDAERIGWAQSVVDGMKAAQAEGRPYFRDANDETAPERVAAPQLVNGRVYVLTDSGCASACLDAVDLWKALGAVQVGRETSADTVYMDIRGAQLSSGLARISLPMKVWRGRARGNNEPQRPDLAWDGSMADTAGIRAWLAGQPTR